MSIADTGVESSAPEPWGAPAPANPANPALRLALLGVLIALLLAACGSFIWLAADRVGNDQSDVQADRERVMSVAQQFMLRLGNHNPSMLDDQGEMPEYRRLVEEVSTTKLWAQLKVADIPVAENLTDQAGLTRTTAVFATGVQSIDQDSATVLVAGQVTDAYRQGDPSEPQAFRYGVQLRRVDGTWLVDGCSSPSTGQPCFSTGGAQ